MRRLQSLSGLFLVLFLMEHLLTNSQAALFFGEDGKGFVDAVNFIYSLPYLPVVEAALLGVPILIHGVWGIQYLLEAKVNSYGSGGAEPVLKLSRNRAYTWQRITSILLVFGILLHVAFMRFINHPTHVDGPETQAFIVPLKMDPGLYTLSPRLGVTLYDEKSIAAFVRTAEQHYNPTIPETLPQTFNSAISAQMEKAEAEKQQEMIAQALAEQPLRSGEVAAVAPSFGTAVLIMVRDTFKSVWICTLYSIFVAAACFHACNGLWTFAITWGITLTENSRRLFRFFSNIILATLLFLGFASIWGTYFINLKA
jgi:succinate dehydrogenase / fumarate reductase cytochrome b subunit